MSKKGYKQTEEHKRHLRENHIGMLGKKHSLKTKEKMKEKNIGWFVKGERNSFSTEFKKGIGTWNKGLKTGELSEIHRKKISKGIIKFYDGNGRTKRLNILLRSRSAWKIWRELVFLRDNFTCQNQNCEFCNNKIGVMLHPHHIKPLALFPELAFRVDNGITYCAEYHIKSGLHKGIQNSLYGGKEK